MLFIKSDMVIEVGSENKREVQGFISAGRQGLACRLRTGLSLPRKFSRASGESAGIRGAHGVSWTLSDGAVSRESL